MSGSVTDIRSTKSKYTPPPADTALEALLKATERQIDNEWCRDVKRQLWAAYARLKNQRSPEMVEHLERKQGIWRQAA